MVFASQTLDFQKPFCKILTPSRTNPCEGVTFDRADLKKAVQKEKAPEGPKETVKLKPVSFEKKSRGVEEEQAELKKIQETMLENAEKLGKKQEIQEKLVKATQDLEKAKESYDNLSVAIKVMREDLKAIHGFKVFQSNAHDQDTPEQYLEALEKDLPQERGDILNPDSKAQLRNASELLKQANRNLAAARLEMERINREMMELA